VLLAHFGDFARTLTDMIRDEAVATAEAAGRPVRCLRSSSVRKENVAKQIQAEHRWWPASSAC
jgi:hypothetical protein